MSARPKSIVLIGMMGAGKSSVGRSLQRRTGWPRFDMDEMVVAKAGLPIPEIFAKHGEKWFRDLETTVLSELNLNESSIVVTGGGVVLRPENVAMLKRLGAIVWLEADVGTLLERASRRGHRPLLQTENPRATLAELLETRRPLYAGIADIRIDTTLLGHEEVTDVILSNLQDGTTPDGE